MEPLPTPYDILPVPPVAYVPGLSEWGICIFVSLLLLGCLLLCRRRRKGLPAELQPFQLARERMQELLQACSGGAADRELLGAASVLIRRLLSAQEQVDYSSMTPVELRTAAAHSEVQELCEFLDMLAALDVERYQSSSDTGIELERLRELVTKLENYRASCEGRAE